MFTRFHRSVQKIYQSLDKVRKRCRAKLIDENFRHQKFLVTQTADNIISGNTDVLLLHTAST